MKKSILTLIVILTAMVGGVFAHDCDLVVGKNIEGTLSNYTTNYAKYLTVIPATAFKQALLNLKAYCCSQIVPTSCTQAEKNILPSLYPESAYFFDDLVDVTMRRLDGIPTLAYGLDVDPTGLARRTYITQAADDPTGVQAMTIEKTYTEYRTGHINTTKNIDTVIDNYDKNNLGTLSLTDKYNTLCEIIKTMYEQTQPNNRTIIGGYGDKNSFFNGCKNLVRERIKKENGYVKILMVQKSNKLFDETTKAYTKKSFVEDKLMTLRTLISKVKDLFQTIVLQAPASQSCSK